MTQYELTKYNIGEDLDSLMNLDPRGYGVCRILYPAAREKCGKALTVNFAEKLLETVHEGDLVYILTGFILPPFGTPETDGIVGSVLLCRTLVKLGVHPVIICPEENIPAVETMAPVVGLHLYKTVEDAVKYPIAMGAVAFTKDCNEAKTKAEALLSHKPAAVIAIEAPGANALGVYHNATGLDVTDMQAKSDVLFNFASEKGIPTFAVGDLGNEIGMGAVGKQLEEYIPYAQNGGGCTCRCGCGGGIGTVSAADTLLTATVSDWGVYGIIAAIAWLKNDINLMHTPEMETEVITAASRAGMIDMYGWLVPAIDGQDASICSAVVKLMRSCVENALSLTEICKNWFDGVLKLGYFEKNSK